MAYTPPKSGAPHQFETGDSPTAGPSFQQPAFTDISGTATNSQLAGPLVNGVTVGVGGDFSLSKTDPLAVGNETLTPGNVTATHLSSPLPVAQGGTATASTLAGVVRGGNPMTAAELSGDATTSGSNVVSVVKVNGNTPGVAAVAHKVVTAIDSSARGTLAQLASADLSDAASFVPSTGTWTPTIRGDGTAGTATYSIQYGRYIKIGPLVIADFQVDWSTFTGATGLFVVAGLPFANANATNNQSENHIADLAGITLDAGYTMVSLEIPPGLSVAYLIEDGSGKAVVYLPPTSIAGSGFMNGTLIYRDA